MKLLLTSGGIKNASIQAALLDLLGKPVAECSALRIPTATYGHPQAGPTQAWRFAAGQEPQCPMVELGWKSMGLLELTALPSIDEERWVPRVRETDVLLVNGGDALYLAHWMRECGLADLLPSLDTVWVGLSGGSMVMSPASASTSSAGSRHRRRPGPGTGRVLDLSAPGQRGPARQFPGQGRRAGSRDAVPGVRDRRRDGDQGRQRQCRRRLGGELEAVRRLTTPTRSSRAASRSRRAPHG